MKIIQNIFYYGFTCFFSLFIAMSCNIDELPYDKLTDEELASSSDAIKSATLGSYSQLKTEQFIKGYHYLGEYTSDNISLSGATTDPLFYIYNFQRSPDNSRLSDQFGLFNKIIINSNKNIEIITSKAEQEGGLSPELSHIAGENYFLRGWILYQLVTTYGKTYHIASINDLGIPIKLTTNINDFPRRSTVKETYVQVLSDLHKAEELMATSEIKESNIYGNLLGVKAILSRVYLQMHDYPNAIKYATEVITLSTEVGWNKRLLSRSEYATMNQLKPEDNPEALFAIKRVKDLDLKDDGENDVGSLYAIIEQVGWGEMYASQPLRDLFSKYPNDVRTSFILPQYLTKDGVSTGKEIIWIDKNYLTNDKGTPDPLSRTYFRSQNVKIIIGTDDYKIDTTGNNMNNIIDFGNSWFIEFKTGKYFATVRQKRTKEDGTIIYSTFKEVEVMLQDRMSKRNDYPKYFMTKCSFQEQQTHLWSPVITRISEMYLNRAEAYAKSGNTGSAIADIDVIKARAGIPSYNSATDGADILEAVLDERRRELYLEAHRYYDLMRNDKVLDRSYPGGHTGGSETSVVLSVKNTDNWAIQFIPQREIEAYPAGVLEQNP